jgi:hypothetical protein
MARSPMPQKMTTLDMLVAVLKAYEDCIVSYDIQYHIDSDIITGLTIDVGCDPPCECTPCKRHPNR